jgi:hypothetical protein
LPLGAVLRAILVLFEQERGDGIQDESIRGGAGTVVSLAGYRDLLLTAGGGKKRSGGKVVGKAITTPSTADRSSSQVPATN